MAQGRLVNFVDSRSDLQYEVIVPLLTSCQVWATPEVYEICSVTCFTVKTLVSFMHYMVN